MNKKFLIPVVAAAAVGMATPALAQSWTISVSSSQSYGSDRGYGYDRGHNRGYGYDRAFQQRKAQLEHRVQRLERMGALNRQERRLFQGLFQHVEGLQRQYSRNGFSPAERRELNAQLDRIQIAVDSHRRDHRRDRRHDRRW